MRLSAQRPGVHTRVGSHFLLERFRKNQHDVVTSPGTGSDKMRPELKTGKSMYIERGHRAVPEDPRETIELPAAVLGAVTQEVSF